MVIQLGIMNIIAYPAVFLSVTIRAKDAFSMRDEFVALLISQSPLTLLCVCFLFFTLLFLRICLLQMLSMFVVPVAYGVFIAASAWSWYVCFFL